MKLGNTIKKRRSIILLTSPVIGLMIATPIFLSIGIEFIRFPLVLLLITHLSFLSWFLNIYFSQNFPKSFNHIFWKWLASTFCMITLVSSLHSLTILIMTFHAPYFWLIRSVNITAVNTIIFIINILIDTRETAVSLENENNQLKISQLESQLAQLKNQINPHFLFNALSSLKSLMKRNPENAENYLIKLSEFLRVSITKNQDLVFLKDELQLCNDYIDLQQMRFGEGLHYQIDIQEDLQNAKIPFFALQSILENAIKHNTVSVSSPLSINVLIVNQQVIVSNNFQPKFALQAASQTGLKNLDTRMKIYAGEGILISKNEETFSVSLKLLKQ
jgi:two-component system, LytTR family, sensor kinase